MISTLEEFAKLSDYSFTDTLTPNPDSTKDGIDHEPRQVFSGHFVPVNPTPIENPEYVAHSITFFKELGLADSLAEDSDFLKMFSGDSSKLPEPMHSAGWATGYALSIYGTEYIQQCPFQTGNGYGDGRAISILETVLNGKRWEMQLKGGGPTPYCRGADGRAVLRSSIREFLAQEHMHALGVPTSRSLSLYVSKTEQVNRPWYSEGSYSEDPDRLVSEAVAISTRVAPSFIRVGQIELFGRRTRKNEYPTAKEELEKLVLHLIDREYSEVIPQHLSTPEKVVLLAKEFRSRLSSLVANWVRVGFCQGNFNSDNCAMGGYTLDYGPFGFCDYFNPQYSPWTGGGQHFSFMNQPNAAHSNFHMFYLAIRHLLLDDEVCLNNLDEIKKEFPKVMEGQMDTMWSLKLGLDHLSSESDKDTCKNLVSELMSLMVKAPVDYTLFFRELSHIPDAFDSLKKSFYKDLTQELYQSWSEWFSRWKDLLSQKNTLIPTQDEISRKMKLVNPKYILREWFLKPAYQLAATGDYTAVRELQEIMTNPYAEQSNEVEEKYYKLKPSEFFELGGVSHLSCSS